MARSVPLLLLAVLAASCSKATRTQSTFPSEDGVPCTADVYLTGRGRSAPFIVLFHQAGYSRGEYQDIAPRLNRLGFGCMAVDARSGGEVQGVQNETVKAALAAGKPVGSYLDALPDLVAALKHARKTYAGGKLIAWGSSYSASLVLQLAASQPGLVDGVVAFSPGEYFASDRSGAWIAESATGLRDLPVFITSGPTEGYSWKRIFEAIPSPGKASYLPQATGSLHGSSALRTNLGSSTYVIPNPLAEGYWAATEAFLKAHFRP
jgi:dienelactone hydrolase